MHLASNNYLKLKLEIFLSHEEELGFETILSVESILSQFFMILTGCDQMDNSKIES